VKGNETKFQLEMAQLSLKARYCLLSCKDKWGQYECLFSNDQQFKQGHTYSIYQFPALIRVLGRKADLFTTNLQKDLYTEDEGLVAILNWKGLHREFIHIHFNKTDEEFIVEFLAKNKEFLNKHIEELKAKARKGDLECP
jgi:hypothetical protein